MPNHCAHALGIRLAHLHAILSASHFARRHHFHRAGDLLSALYARDLGADFLANCHAVLPGLRRLESFDG